MYFNTGDGNNSRLNFLVRIYDDSQLEKNETFYVNVLLNDRSVRIATSRVKVYILENSDCKWTWYYYYCSLHYHIIPAVNVSLSAAFFDVSEAQNMLQICATLSANDQTARDFGIMLNTIDNTGAY